MRKEIGLSATVRVTLGSIEVMRVRGWGPGHLQSSVASLRRLGRAGSEDSCLGPGGNVQIPRGGFGWSTFQCPFMHSWDMDLEGALALGISGPSGLLCCIWSRPQVASFLCWLMEAWSYVGQWLKGGIWPDLFGPSLALPVLPFKIENLKN